MTQQVNLGAATGITDRAAAHAFRLIAFAVHAPGHDTMTIDQADLGEFVRLGQMANQAAPQPAPVAAAITAASSNGDDRAAHSFLGIIR